MNIVPQKLHRIRLPRATSGTLSCDLHFQFGHTRVTGMRFRPFTIRRRSSLGRSDPKSHVEIARLLGGVFFLWFTLAEEIFLAVDDGFVDNETASRFQVRQFVHDLGHQRLDDAS